MSDQFYSYLTDKIIKYFRNNLLRPGDKFYIQFEEEKEVENLYLALQENTLYQQFKYEDIERNEIYETYYLDFGSVKLVLASTYDNIHPDFLANLRNVIGVEDGYKDKAILFIHNSTLDSIVGGAGSFHKEGMPFSIKTIVGDIEKKLNASSFNETDKAILRMHLNNIQKELEGGNPTIFEYRELLSGVEKSGIELTEYNSFGLFPDANLGKYAGRKLIKRLEDNTYNYARVSEMHSYGLSESKLEKYYDEKGVDKLKGENWNEVHFNEIEKFIENKKNKPVIEYIPMVTSMFEWDREQGASKAKFRVRNIILFNVEETDEYTIELCFTEFVKKENITDSPFSCSEASGKRIKATLTNISGNATFYFIKYKEGTATFQFRIVVVSCGIKYLNNLKTDYSVITKGKSEGNYILINSDESIITFNEFDDSASEVFINEKDQLIFVEDNKLMLNVDDRYPFTDDNDMVSFKLCINDCVIPFQKAGTVERPKVIEGMRLWKFKRDTKMSFEYLSDNKLIHGTKSYFAREEFKSNLELEKRFIEAKSPALYEDSDGLHELELRVNKKVLDKFLKIIDYYKRKQTLPSLAYLESSLKQVYLDFIKVYLEELKSIEDESYLTKEQKDLFFVGTIKRTINEQELMLTPLHPLNIAYQLHVDSIDTSVILESEMDLLKKFQQLYLLPFINQDPFTKERCTLIPIEQSHSAEWKTYVNESLPRYKGSKDYVSKLVAEKIEEFIDHFEYLFTIGGGAPIMINLFNTGDSKEILQGIFKFYVKSLRKKKRKDILPMVVNVYVDRNVTNMFDEFAAIEDVETLKRIFHLDLNVDDMNEDEVVDLYREKVNFYSKDVEDDKLHFAHITFIEMLEGSEVNTTSMEDIPTGVVFKGISSGNASTLLGDTYRTGFGTKFAVENSTIMELAIRLNAINASINGDQYSKGRCSTISISNRKQVSLDKIYDASNWVTFINPKVDLSYFKNDPSSKDLIIIHYSDQYNTTSSGYDAITVTRKSRQYQNVIEEYLADKGVVNSKEKSSMIINTFNAVNGDWLLRLLSNKSYFPKEKLSILSAIKYSIKKFQQNNIIWIPISLEEILRVSGGVGLRKKDGLFSAKNLGFENNGATSDDILMIGIENLDRPKVTFYPVEVKIGKNAIDVIEKGIKQAKETKRIFRDTLQKGNDIKVSIYRNFFMQLAVSSAEKLVLYDVGDGNQGWELVVNSELRKKLLNEEYDIVDSLNKNMGDSCVLSFKAESYGVDDRMQDNILIIEKNEIDGINMIGKGMDEIIIESIPYEKGYEDIVIDSPISNTAIDESENEVATEENSNPIESDDKVIEDQVKGETKYHSESDEKTQNQEEARSMQILFGTKQDVKKELYWRPNDSSKVLHTNTGIIGTMGTGKTQFTKSLVTQIYREAKYNLNGAPIGILIFDYKGDYNYTKQDFINATNAKVYSLCDLPFNPLSLTLTEHSKQMLPLHTANSLKETISKAFGLGIKQETLFRELIMETYEKFGIIKNNPSTWSKQAPTLQDVYNIYINREDLKEDSLYAAFSNIIDFQIFERDGSKTVGLYDFIDGVTVIDLSGFDPGIQNLVVAITLDLFYAQMQGYGHSKLDGDLRQLNKFILVDEADNFISKDFDSLKKILKEGREFGVGTILSTQLLSHFSTGDNDYSNYILTWVIHNVADLNNKDIRYIFNTKNKSEEEYIFSKIKRLQKHHSLVKMGDNDNPISIRDKAFWELEK